MRFDGTISMGNLLVAATILGSIGTGFIANRERTLENKADIARLEIKTDGFELRLRALEIEVAKGAQR